MMNFTYSGYLELLNLLKEHGYNFANYNNWQTFDKCVIMRHDIDYSMQKACELAKTEYKAGVNATYFVLLSSDFYNVFSFNNMKYLQEIQSYGHEIGLHFDEKRYPESFGKPEKIIEKILQEAEILSKAINQPVTKVSMHRPSAEILESDLQIPGMINSYASTGFHEFKYLSDSRRFWREPVKEIIEQEQFKQLHLLTHAFWYNDTEQDISVTVKNFINLAESDRYFYLSENIRDIASIVRKEEL